MDVREGKSELTTLSNISLLTGNCKETKNPLSDRISFKLHPTPLIRRTSQIGHILLSYDKDNLWQPGGRLSSLSL